MLFSRMDKKDLAAASDHNLLNKPRVPPASRTLVWVRKDLVQSKSFTPSDCYPARSGFLPKPTVVKFADLRGRLKEGDLSLRSSRWPVEVEEWGEREVPLVDVVLAVVSLQRQRQHRVRRRSLSATSLIWFQSRLSFNNL
jgi:hypothetical protein